MIRKIINASTMQSIMMMTAVTVGSFMIAYYGSGWLISMVGV